MGAAGGKLVGGRLCLRCAGGGGWEGVVGSRFGCGIGDALVGRRRMVGCCCCKVAGGRGPVGSRLVGAWMRLVDLAL